MVKVHYIDPPSGWKYGFPKVLPEGVENVMEWLVENGYPQWEIDSCGKHFHCRHWEKEIDESDDNYFISNEEYIKLVKKAADEIELLREENEKLREELITSSEKYYDIGYACAKDMQKDRIESSEEAYVRLDAAMNRLKGAFRVNMLRAFPNMSHDEIDAEINKAVWENDDE